MIDLAARVERSLDVALPAEEVFFVLADVPYSVAHFPDVERLVEERGGFTWHLKPVGFRSLRVRTIYACRYASDPVRLTVDWVPIEGIGNARVTGRWTLTAEGDRTRVGFVNEFVLSIDVPPLVRPAAGPFVRRQLAGKVDLYLANLARTFAGDEGRVSLR